MRLIKACVEALAILSAMITVIGGCMAFIVFTAAAAQVVGVWLFPVVILGAYLCFVFALYMFNRKGGGKREVPSVGTDNPQPGSTGSVVKLNDETVATAILAARERERAIRRRPTEYDEPV